MTEIEMFEQVWPWVNGYLGMLQRKYDDPELPKSVRVELNKVGDTIIKFVADLDKRFPTEIHRIVLENR
jgi:hypothetical protein